MKRRGGGKKHQEGGKISEKTTGNGREKRGGQRYQIVHFCLSVCHPGSRREEEEAAGGGGGHSLAGRNTPLNQRRIRTRTTEHPRQSHPGAGGDAAASAARSGRVGWCCWRWGVVEVEVEVCVCGGGDRFLCARSPVGAFLLFASHLL